MPRRPRNLLLPLLAAACLGAGGGAVAYATLSDGGTVVRQVTVQRSEPVSSSNSATLLSVNSIYRRAYRGVVQITIKNDSGFGGSSTAQGSGFVYDSTGHVITNDHVVDSGGSITVQFWNNKTYSARLVASDASTDLAVLDVDAPASILHPLALGDSAEVQVGDAAVAIGSPFGLEETVTSGIISALHRSIDALNRFTISDAIQTDAAINHGNSGGPLLSAQGRVIGVNAQIRSDGGGSDGVGFAIPSNTVRSVASQLISSGKAEHAYLGVQLDSAAASARVGSVSTGTPASKAGLRAGDVIVEVGGTSVSSADELTSVINSHKPGDSVTVRYRRNGEVHSVQLRLATRPS